MNDERHGRGHSTGLAVKLQIDGACDLFELAWKSGNPPNLEACLCAWQEPARTSLFQELLAIELVYRMEGGEIPSSADYEGRFPEYRHLVIKAFRELDAVGRMCRESASGGLSNDAITITYVAITPTGSVTLLLDAAGYGELNRDFTIGTVLNKRYTLERELGHGGMGQVFLGTDKRLNREVAIKVMLTPKRVIGRNARVAAQRAFRTEARLGANLLHPAIATVFDFGIHE